MGVELGGRMGFAMKTRKFFLVLCLVVVNGLAVHAQELRVHGANAIWAPLNAKVMDLEKATGAKINFVPNAAGRGLADLAQGKCDIAMVTGSLEGAAQGANEENPGLIKDLGEFVVEKIGSEPVVFVVNPSNTVSQIKLEQAVGILTGKITNWKEVGGPDMEITVVRLGPTNGPHIALEKEVLKGQKITEKAKPLKAPKDVPVILSQLPGGFSYIGATNVTEKLKVLKTDKEFTMEMMLVTKGAPNEMQKKFIEEAKKILSGN